MVANPRSTASYRRSIASRRSISARRASARRLCVSRRRHPRFPRRSRTARKTRARSRISLPPSSSLVDARSPACSLSRASRSISRPSFSPARPARARDLVAIRSDHRLRDRSQRRALPRAERARVFPPVRHRVRSPRRRARRTIRRHRARARGYCRRSSRRHFHPSSDSPLSPRSASRVHPRVVRVVPLARLRRLHRALAHVDARATIAPSSSSNTVRSFDRCRRRCHRSRSRVRASRRGNRRSQSHRRGAIRASGDAIGGLFFASGSDECERAQRRQRRSVRVVRPPPSMWAYFSRDNVALKGFADHFKNESLEERAHAEQLMEYMNLRGGRRVATIAPPPNRNTKHGEGMRAVRPRTQSESGKIEQR